MHNFGGNMFNDSTQLDLTHSDNETDVERRHTCPSRNKLWSKLNVAQQAAVSSLSHYGYELSFIRDVNSNQVVVLLLNGSSVTIDSEGNIETNCEIPVRSTD